MNSAPFALPLRGIPSNAKTLDVVADANGNIAAIFKVNIGPSALDYIVNACNGHAALVEAVQLAIRHMPYSQDPEVAKAVEKLHTALKLAGAA